MKSKRDILTRIKRQKLEAIELPSLDRGWIQYDDRQWQFASALEQVGGRAIFVEDSAALFRELARIPSFCEANRICSLIDGVERANVELDAIDDPHELEDIDFAILPAEFGVAENAAIWVTDASVKHRAIYFIVQHLALVVRSSEILDNMHQAYDLINLGGKQFGVFISGPSKTADIEQSLVIGAHGPRSLTVFLIQEERG